MDYKYTELDYAKEIYENGLLSKQHMPTELRLLATYMRRVLNNKPKKLREEMYRWCESHISGYQKELYYKAINSAIQKACQKNSMLVNIKNVDFYKYELDYINNLYIMSDIDTQKESKFSYDCKKILFTLLFQIKMTILITYVKHADTSAEYSGKYFKGGQRKYTELKKLARLPEKIRIHEDIMNTLWINGLISPIYNGIIKLDFMDNIYERQNNSAAPDTDVVLQIKDFDAVGWYFDYYNHDKKIAFCKECGKIYKKTSNRQAYCSDKCAKDVNIEKTKKRRKKNGL